MTAEFVTLGEALFAFVASERGPLFEARAFSGHVVGAEVNTAVAIQRLGRQTAFIGRVGADGLGTAIRRRLRAEGVSVTHLSEDDEAPTGVLARSASPGRPVEVVYARSGSAGARLHTADVEAARATIEGARWLHATGITAAISHSARMSAEHAIATARAAGCTVSLDLNFRRKLWTPAEAEVALTPLVGAADVVFCGLDEAQALWGSVTAAAAAETILECGAQVAIVRCDASDVLHRAAGEAPIEHVVTPVPVVDAVGAGDAFNGGYIAARLEGRSYPAAVELGEVCKSLALSALGDITGLPSRAEAEAAGVAEVHR